MRPVLLSDLTTTARAVLAAVPENRAALCREIFLHADAADRYARRLKKPHPDWGNGTLLAAVSALPLARERSCNDRAYRACIQLVLAEIDRRDWKAT